MPSNGRAPYNVDILPSAQRELERLPTREVARVAAALQRLASDPRPSQSTKLVGFRDEYRLRIGWYRVLYKIKDARRSVLVYRIAHRKDVYR